MPAPTSTSIPAPTPKKLKPTPTPHHKKDDDDSEQGEYGEGEGEGESESESSHHHHRSSRDVEASKAPGWYQQITQGFFSLFWNTDPTVPLINTRISQHEVQRRMNLLTQLEKEVKEAIDFLKLGLHNDDGSLNKKLYFYQNFINELKDNVREHTSEYFTDLQNDIKILNTEMVKVSILEEPAKPTKSDRFIHSSSSYFSNATVSTRPMLSAQPNLDLPKLG